jgi:amidase
MTQIHELTVLELAAAYRRRELSPVDSVDHYLRRIDDLDPEVGAFFTVAAERARDQARTAETAIQTAEDLGHLPPLTGVPVPIKDVNMVAGLPHTYGSAAFEDNVAAENDYVTSAILAAGGVITGKTATSEFGLPCHTEAAVGSPTRNPWDLSRSAGGSSGGAAAAVAAGLAPAAQGSDSCGSIRIPASACGTFGLKPSRGRISTAPSMLDSTGLTTDGAITRTVADAALLLDVMAGNRPGDLYTQPAPLTSGTFLAQATREPRSLRIGRSLQSPISGASPHPDCVAAYEDASRLLRGLGHEVEDMVMPVGSDMVPAAETLLCATAALPPLDASREGLLLPFTRYLRERGKATSATELIQAQAYLQLVMRMALPVLSSYDAVLTPTLAAPPVPVGYFTQGGPVVDLDRQKRFSPFAALYNLSGQPAVSLPLYWNSFGLPVGVMLGGRIGDEATLISLSAQLEQARPWKDRHPPLW